MFVVPAATAVTSPELLTVALEVSEEFQETLSVQSVCDRSDHVHVAVNCSVSSMSSDNAPPEVFGEVIVRVERVSPVTVTDLSTSSVIVPFARQPGV